MESTTLTIRLSSADKKLISDVAKAYGKTMSDFVRDATIERIEDELDLKAWDEAKAEYDADPVSFSAAEIAEKYL